MTESFPFKVKKAKKILQEKMCTIFIKYNPYSKIEVLMIQPPEPYKTIKESTDSMTESKGSKKNRITLSSSDGRCYKIAGENITGSEKQVINFIKKTVLGHWFVEIELSGQRLLLNKNSLCKRLGIPKDDLVDKTSQIKDKAKTIGDYVLNTLDLLQNKTDAKTVTSKDHLPTQKPADQTRVMGLQPVDTQKNPTNELDTLQNEIALKKAAADVKGVSPKSTHATPLTPSETAAKIKNKEDLISHVKKRYDKKIPNPEDIENPHNIQNLISFVIEQNDVELLSLLIEADIGMKGLDLQADKILTCISLKLISNPKQVKVILVNLKILKSSIALINRGADPTLNNEFGQNALQELVKYIDCTDGSCLDLKTPLLKFFDKIDDTNRSAAINLLHSTSNPDIIKHLVSKGLNVDSLDDTGKTALSSAFIKRDKALIEVLIKLGANPKITTKVGEREVLSPLRRIQVEKENLVREIRNLKDQKVSIDTQNLKEPPANFTGVQKLKGEQQQEKDNPIKKLTPHDKMLKGRILPQMNQTLPSKGTDPDEIPDVEIPNQILQLEAHLAEVNEMMKILNPDS